MRKSPGIIDQDHSLKINLPSCASSTLAHDEVPTLLLLTTHVHTLRFTGPPTMKVHILCLVQSTHTAVLSLHITQTIPCGIWGWHLLEDLKSLRTLHIECPSSSGEPGHFIRASSSYIPPSTTSVGHGRVILSRLRSRSCGSEICT
jgi:hypothetical protein